MGGKLYSLIQEQRLPQYFPRKKTDEKKRDSVDIGKESLRNTYANDEKAKGVARSAPRSSRYRRKENDVVQGGKGTQSLLPTLGLGRATKRSGAPRREKPFRSVYEKRLLELPLKTSATLESTLGGGKEGFPFKKLGQRRRGKKSTVYEPQTQNRSPNQRTIDNSQ